MMKRLVGYYCDKYYRIEVNGKEVYRAGNSPLDSQVYLSEGGVGLVQMRDWCEQTCKEMASEMQVGFIGLHKIRKGEE
jgi:hypothetical protein